jgi:2-C-methyl-D-erythritol 4-phosphate cytidylyltransferase
VVGLPLDETLKRVDRGAVVETVARSGLWRVQTPQTFLTDALVRAHEAARRDGFVATDDAQLVERYGRGVVVVAGSTTNIKLTYPGDFAIAEALLAMRAINGKADS